MLEERLKIERYKSFSFSYDICLLATFRIVFLESKFCSDSSEACTNFGIVCENHGSVCQIYFPCKNEVEKCFFVSFCLVLIKAVSQDKMVESSLWANNRSVPTDTRGSSVTAGNNSR